GNVVGKRRNDFDRNEVVGTVDSTLSRFVLSVQPSGTDDRQKYLALRHLIIQACIKVDPDEIHEEILVPKCLRYPVVQPTGGVGRTFSTVIDENLTEHASRPPKTNSTAEPVKSTRCSFTTLLYRPRRREAAGGIAAGDLFTSHRARVRAS